MDGLECYWCHKSLERPGYVVKYDDRFYCDETCLGQYLVEQAEDEYEVIWNDTEENIKICELEKKAER